jgi:2-amino-4-hydroxy-6-hydroxymethyldihydropteridine diphosphokinase
VERVFLGLGSNKGDGKKYIKGAFEALGERLEGPVISSLYASAPMYVLDQPAFLNAVVSGLFPGNPYELLSFVQSVEARFGRDRSKERRRGERSLDIDILLFGELQLTDNPRLVIPHEGLLDRKFALLPLLELDPGLQDPRNGKPLYDAFAALGMQGIYYADLGPYNALGRP